mmetsp:Transcript_6689/g.10881  ORF Transcript_6689/g.10881 Transcript_6689/m.10881 type:complete len:113 (+) Transcript_6689:141-479(+)
MSTKEDLVSTKRLYSPDMEQARRSTEYGRQIKEFLTDGEISLKRVSLVIKLSPSNLHPQLSIQAFPLKYSCPSSGLNPNSRKTKEVDTLGRYALHIVCNAISLTEGTILSMR